MAEWIKIILWILLVPVGLVILYLASVIVLGMITFYSPPSFEQVDVPQPCRDDHPWQDTLTLVTWNMGYSGLGKEMDFFYEDGEKVRPDRDLYDRYIKGITEWIRHHEEVGLFLFQEVDQRAKRSYRDDQVKRIQNSLPGHHVLFTPNYRVRFVPLPFLHPMGRVNSGLVLAGRICLREARRYAFPPDESWPTRLFMLQRCFLRVEMTFNNEQLTVINTHNSAYDETGEAKSVQLDMLRREALDAYRNGNFVIAGGDWNQNPPGYQQTGITSGDAVKTIQPLIPASLMPEGWKWVYDPSQPTNRDVNKPYVRGETRTTLIDYFLVSPNVEVLEVKTIPVAFEFTDHQPVYMKVRLIRP
jgi:endonuclease/exonuclease/phosphatase family metal-dependent hydrolase